MARHPFKFFFGLSLGLIVFFFVARVFVMAVVLAAVLSLIFFVGRKIKNFFKYMTWEDDNYYERRAYRSPRTLPFWEREEESFFDNFEPRKRQTEERFIEIG